MTIISNEPEADADDFNDEQALETYLGIDAQISANRSAGSVDLPDWPTSRLQDIGLNLDSETIAWFKARHADWRAEMCFVLRAWTVAQARTEVLPTDI